jgi:hypothetical protein
MAACGEAHFVVSGGGFGDVPVTSDQLDPDAVQPRDAIAAQLAYYGEEQVVSIRRDLPKPPPTELGFDPVKWQRMTRAERRAVLRYARKVQK